MIEPYDFVFPVSQTKVLWKPLEVGKQLDLTAAYRKDEVRHLLLPALLAARITRYGDKAQCTIADLRAMDDIDYDAFSEEVERKESERRASYRKKAPAESSAAKLRALAEEARVILDRVKQVLDDAVAKAIDAEASSGAGPLSSA